MMFKGMDHRKIYRYLWTICLLVVFTFGCSLVTRVSGLKSTAMVVQTQVQSGREVFGTGEAVVTKKGGSLVNTVEAAATQVEKSGLPQTTQAVVTEVSGSSLPKTAEALVTQVSNGGLQETAKSVVTQVYTSPEQAPQDIPIMEGEKNAFVGSPLAI